MPTPQQLATLAQCAAAAAATNHPWPAAAACEAALETATTKLGWFTSLGFHYNNLLGIKATSLWHGGTVWLHGWEVVSKGAAAPYGMRNPVRSGYDATHDEWSGEMEWCAFPDFSSCYRLQMKILAGSRYAPAMAATNAEDYIRLESAVWATGPARGQTVTAIYHSHSLIPTLEAV